MHRRKKKETKKGKGKTMIFLIEKIQKPKDLYIAKEERREQTEH